jgi:gamma-glutamyl-gamma-aminobutyrate hydrolase PuuD
MNILVLGGGGYKNAFAGKHAYLEANAVTVTSDNLYWADIVVFTGGTDVSPEVYDEVRYVQTCAPDNQRDFHEHRIFEACKVLNKLMVGICRGSQFLTVMSGGKLIQDVSNHAVGRGHEMVAAHPALLKKSLNSEEFTRMVVSSTHHQMMYPFNLQDKDYTILAYAKGLSKYYDGRPQAEQDIGALEPTEGYTIEPEVVYYSETKCLCVQYHPEMMAKDSQGHKYFNELADYYCE